MASVAMEVEVAAHTRMDATAADDNSAPAAAPLIAAAANASPKPLTALTPEIRWHCGPTGLNEAVLSIDFLPAAATPAGAASTTSTVLATGGADKEIKLWRVRGDLHDHSGLEFVFSLSGHDRSVNCVRFSPNGEFLASASDDSTIILWMRPKSAVEDWAWDKIESFSDVARTLLACGHKGDITDLAWSPDSAFLCSTSVDNSCVIWNAEKGEVEERRKDHTQYVQGVAWDPLNEFLATEGNDRSCRVYALSGFDPVSRLSAKKIPKKCVSVQTLKTREFPPSALVAKTSESSTPDASGSDPTPSPAAAADAKQSDSKAAISDSASSSKQASAAEPAAPKHRLFHDDTCPAFARRLTWTPDGSYLLAPTGIFRATEAAAPANTVYAFARGNLNEPTLHLPGQEKASLGVRCSPLLYELRRSTDGSSDSSHPTPNFFQTPHRSIFAVITLNTVVIYDSQHPHPICTLKDLHYADLTDASWSSDGQLLSVSSMDGYLSFIKFQDGFFGAPVPRAAHSEMNKLKMRAMFATPKLARKKQKADADANGAAKKKLKAAAPAGRKKADAKAPTDAAAATAPAPTPPPAASGAVVNTLQVRKKRTIAPVLVQPPPAASAASAAQQPTAGGDSEDSASGEPVLL
ncbi:hypothetical protein PybrP1_005022 [[Pythium] brassicae (nom. inval.)]|nr:hypothetical protein PybrP1_005022 [[Pythium] brassicae (nom. inval.)]